MVIDALAETLHFGADEAVCDRVAFARANFLDGAVSNRHLERARVRTIEDAGCGNGLGAGHGRRYCRLSASRSASATPA